MILWMGHQAKDVACLVADARDVIDRTVGIVWIARVLADGYAGRGVAHLGGIRWRHIPEGGQALAPERLTRLFIGGKAPLTMRYRTKDILIETLCKETAALGDGPQTNPTTFKVGALVDRERCALLGRWAGQIARLDQGLEAVADAHHRLAHADELVETGSKTMGEVIGPEPARPQVIAVREATRQYQHLIVAHLALSGDQSVDVHDLGAASGQFASQGGLAVAVGARRVQDHDTGFTHCAASRCPRQACRIALM